ncbi:repressor of RNA polymerase III transcription MAF1 homolog [Clonorchis sinensis]|uniref:Repressor of RNA polymerase III transcription MAF1 homolog n=1 Tax=Clonorchis sinensis TaxID=79923 RepID=G7YGR3_CLOSI|nr:repressor of RNA polymerase III transcription MAF1 homolog [Clonorchis sinensis]
MKLLDQVHLERLVSELSGASKRYNVDVRLESYSCKMVSEEKRQFKELCSRIGSDKQDTESHRLGSSQTLRGLWEMTGQAVNPELYQMSTAQEQPTTAVAHLPANSGSTTAKKRSRSNTASSSDDGASPSSPTRYKTTASGLSVKDLFCLMSTLNSCFGPEYDFLSARSDEFCLEPELWVVKHYISQFCSVYVDKYEDISPELWKTIEEEIVPSQCLIYSYRPDHLSDPYSSGCLASFNYFFHNKSLRRVLFFSLRVLNDPLSADDFEDEMQDLF